jgi:hypothetical protein
MLHRNGTPPTATAADKQTASAPPRTEFPPNRPIDSSRALIYSLTRRQFVGLPLIRWLYGLLLAAALLCLLLPSYGGWAATAMLALAAALWVWQWTARRGSYVRFTPLPAPPVEPRPLLPSAKLPVYVSGLLAVENKARLFGGLPGFYRTFGTREHALICQVRRAGLTSWPEEELGLWYAFFTAGHVHGLRTGEIAFDRRSLPGFALDYTPPQPLGGKKKRRPQRLTLYVAFPQAADFYTALADLAVEPLQVYSS